jgi:hypothetical protein
VHENSDQEPALTKLTDSLRDCEEEVAGLEIALAGRRLIGRAQGMLMLRYGLDEDRAFAFLARQSQDQNIKVREVAQRVAAELIKHPWPEEPAPSPQAPASIENPLTRDSGCGEPEGAEAY